MKLYQRPESGIYYIDYKPKGGKRKRLSTGTKVEIEAQEMFDKLKHESWRQKKLNEKPKISHSWEETVVRYRKDKINKKSQNSMSADLKHLDKYLKGIMLEDIDEELVNHIKYSRQAETYQRRKDGEKYQVATSTANRTLQQLRAVLKCAEEWRWIDHAPTVKLIELPGGEAISYNWLSKDEAQAVLNELPYHLKMLMKFALSTGLSESNVTGLKWKKVNLNKKIAYVSAVDSKNKQNIPISLNDDAMKVLLELQGNHETNVFTYKGQPVKKANTAAWRKALDRAGIRPYLPPPSAEKQTRSNYPTNDIKSYKYIDFRWHDLRHTWASWHVESGTPLLVLQELGGWKSYEMVLRYSHLSASHIASFANNISLDE